MDALGRAGSSAGAALLILLEVAWFATTSRAQPSPSPAPGPAIHLLNPSASYDSGLDPVEDGDPPKLSDKLDADATYHVVAWQDDPRPDEIVEASIRYAGENEISVGTLARSPTDPHVWEMSWDIPSSLPEGEATFAIYLFGITADGVVQRAVDETVVEVAHQDPEGIDPDDTTPAAEAVEISWPAQAGDLGFYKPRGGSWATAVDGVASRGTGRVSLAYTTAPMGEDPQFKPCGRVNIRAAARPFPFQATCILPSTAEPSAVTAVAAVAQRVVGDRLTEMVERGAADVHVARPYEQEPGAMTLELDRAYARDMRGTCVSFVATVRDALGRPVQGANLDAHLSGPNDAVQFGGRGSAAKAPDDREAHRIQPGSNCSGAQGSQEGLHRVPGGHDVKHRESFRGTGLDGPVTTSAAVPAGEWHFSMYSATPGFGDVRVWLDEEESAEGATQRPSDDDALELGEPTTSARAQWFATPPVVTFAPAAATGSPTGCIPQMMKARSGTAPVPSVNVDLHVESERDEARFCTPPGAMTTVAAPDDASHSPLDASQSRHVEADGAIVHAEGQTDSEGNLVFGLHSPVPGSATVSAWVDGEPEVDDDVMGGGEAGGVTTTSWVDCTTGGHLSFVSPTAFGPSTRGPGKGLEVSTKIDADGGVHVVVRSDCSSFVPAVRVEVGGGQRFTEIGRGARIPGTDTYEVSWSPLPPDGTYTLRARAEGFVSVEEHTVFVNAEDFSGGDLTDQAGETVEVSVPGNATTAAFVAGATALRGVASAGAEGIDLFYARTSPGDTPGPSDWTACGYVDLDGTGSAPQSFAGSCKLRAPDQPAEVTAVAALAVDCGLARDGCDASPSSDERDLPTFKKDSGDAHRVHGQEAFPSLSVAPAENEATAGDCTAFTVSLADGTLQPMPGENVDVHVTGPGDDAAFCSVPSTSDGRPPAEGGHALRYDGQTVHAGAEPDTPHLEGDTDPEGSFTFGVSSDAPGDTEITAWLDRLDDDHPAGDETADGAVMHWISTPRCSLSGTPRADRLHGTPDRDRICAGAGDDSIFGAQANDVLFGGPGRDRLFGGVGDDVLRGGTGRDRLRGGGGRDVCSGGGRRDAAATCERRRPTSTSRHV